MITFSSCNVKVASAAASKQHRPFCVAKGRSICVKVSAAASSSTGSDRPSWSQAAGALALAAAVQLGVLAPSAMATRAPLTFDDMQSLTYLEVKGSGLANTCPIIAPLEGDSRNLPAGSYEIERFCLEPSAFLVRESGRDEFDPSKVLTRQTYTLDMMTGKLDMGSNGPRSLALNQDGIDFAAVSLQPIPAGEYVPLMFTARNMSLQSDPAAGELRGDYTVPSYRGATFMDPKGRGAAQGYQHTVGLQAAPEEEYRTNQKTTEVRKGLAKLQVNVVDVVNREVGGTFEMLQGADDDLGAKTPADIAVLGRWYARMV